MSAPTTFAELHAAEQRRAALSAAILAPFPKLRMVGTAKGSGVLERTSGPGAMHLVSNAAIARSKLPRRIAQRERLGKLPALVACPDPARRSPSAPQRRARRDMTSRAVTCGGEVLGVAAYDLPLAMAHFLRTADTAHKSAVRGYAWETASLAVEYVFGTPMPLQDAHALAKSWAGRERGWQLHLVDGSRLESRFNDPRGVRYLALPGEAGALQRVISLGPPLRRSPSLPDGSEPPASMLVAGLGGGDGDGCLPSSVVSGGWWYESPPAERAGLSRAAAGRRGVGLGRAGRVGERERFERARAAGSRLPSEDAVSHLAAGLRNDAPRAAPPRPMPSPFEGMGAALVPTAKRAQRANRRRTDPSAWGHQIDVLQSAGAAGRGALVASARLLEEVRSVRFPSPSQTKVIDDAPWWGGPDASAFTAERLAATVHRNPGATAGAIDSDRIHAAAEEVVARDTEARAEGGAPRVGRARNVERQRLRGRVAALLGVDLHALELTAVVDAALRAELRKAEAIALEVERLGLRR
jgi:hypothetical protein